MAISGETTPQESGFVPTEQEVRPAASVAEVLDRAADLLERDGVWIQGRFSLDENGEADCGFERWASKPVCWCALGAIAYVAGVTPPEAIEMKLDQPLERELPDDWGSVPGWNDAPDRTQAEVVAALRQAAAIERAKLPVTGDLSPSTAGTERSGVDHNQARQALHKGDGTT